jgi:hypothetical protein
MTGDPERGLRSGPNVHERQAQFELASVALRP